MRSPSFYPNRAKFTESHRNTVQSHVDDEGCTVTTRTEYVDSAYHGQRKEDVFTTKTTSRPEIYLASLNRTVPEIYQTENTSKIGDWFGTNTEQNPPLVSEFGEREKKRWHIS
jgi:hypothetical protein